MSELKMTENDAMRVRPFSSGSEGYDWLSANCDRCTKKGEPDQYGEGPCVMETEVSKGFILGTIDAKVAADFGAMVREKFCTMPRQCSQFAPVMICESTRTRTRRKCGKPATEKVGNNDLIRTLCAHHYRVWLADDETELPPRALPSSSPESK